MEIICLKNNQIKPHQKLCLNHWDVDALIPTNYRLSTKVLDNVDTSLKNDFFVLLSRDVYSEGDASFLYNYLLSRRQDLSKDFLALLPLWLGDEQKHYQALSRVYGALSGLTTTTMDSNFHRRSPSLEPIAWVLQDEFTIVSTLVFDELGSMLSYRRDLREYYQPFGKTFARVAQHLVQDEGSHFRHFLNILKQNYPHRLKELPDFFHNLINLEKSLGRYYHTFLLDHAQEMHRFPSYFSAVVVQLILAELNLGDRPSSTVVKSLTFVSP
ncbi:ferritin-like domain-containing protein [Synechocystis salina LEGE 06099]|uniref:ferritin-like domain-containing protein n=1 Tax=Synechocystis salina TaxID=945780 RepID=UPI00187DDE37|nr:ferritin-like domain-containing protein [Synechocystis salina]MBE9204481.1 ferritin-like domain-containing protein [Synechocystis salina LEGE 06099]